MAYSGYLIKIGNYIFPIKGKVLKFKKFAYKVQDLDPFRNGKGMLVRNVLPNIPAKVEFEIREGLTSTAYDVIMNNIRANYIRGKEAERRSTVTLFIPELGDYITQDMYLAEPEITIVRQESPTVLIYDTIRFAWIGY